MHREFPGLIVGSFPVSSLGSPQHKGKSRARMEEKSNADSLETGSELVTSVNSSETRQEGRSLLRASTGKQGTKVSSYPGTLSF